MFKLIGGAVVYGFAMYGLVKFLSRSEAAPVEPGDAAQLDKAPGDAALGSGARLQGEEVDAAPIAD